ncbi:MAG: AMP-binding protein, partial [Albidovulum sp.]|uniref:AMP-binding protein n=1 Tax=Albidovulum sp. TaxID=1872424 RepID=UPI003C8AA3C9
MHQPICELCLDFRSLTDAMDHWSTQTPGNPALSFLAGDNVTTLSYADLHQRALAIAGELLSHCEPEDRVILGYEQSLDYVAGFLGCVYAGTVAVTSSPPTELRRSTRLTRLIEDSGAVAILTNDAAKDAFDQVGGKITLVNSDHMTAALLAAPRPAQPEDLMFLQYTSGSTSDPKGVMLSHGSIGANLRAIVADTRPEADSVYVSWLPLYHDMGLIFMTLAPLFAGRPVYLMSPTEFLRHPERWLEAISFWRGTITAAPNFAYRLCCERVRGQKVRSLDLSSMKFFINGSEPIRTEDMDTFVEAFSAAGLRRDAMIGGYGMAELGVYASIGPIFTTDTHFDAQNLADEGRAVAVAPGTTARRLAACGCANPEHFDLC